MSLRYGIKESDQLWVCCVFKSLCVFILFTLRGFHYLCSKSRHRSGCFPCFSLIPAVGLGPSPKPSLPHLDPGGLLGWEPAEYSLCCLAVPTSNLLHSRAEFSFQICQVNGIIVLLLLFYSYFIQGLSVCC